ncbi:MAG: LptF/LptG family permease [Nitrospirota bacterium]
MGCPLTPRRPSFSIQKTTSSKERSRSRLRTSFLASSQSYISSLKIPYCLPFVNSQSFPSTFTALGLAVCVGFLYYVVNAVSLAFGKGGFFPPILAAWITPAIFTAMAMTIIETKSLN